VTAVAVRCSFSRCCWIFVDLSIYSVIILIISMIVIALFAFMVVLRNRSTRSI